MYLQTITKYSNYNYKSWIAVVFSLLLIIGSNSNYLFLQHGRTALHYACALPDAQDIEDLLAQYGADDTTLDDVSNVDFAEQSTWMLRSNSLNSHDFAMVASCS